MAVLSTTTRCDKCTALHLHDTKEASIGTLVRGLGPIREEIIYLNWKCAKCGEEHTEILSSQDVPA